MNQISAMKRIGIKQKEKELKKRGHLLLQFTYI